MDYKQIEAVIVGGGPAGSACGIELLRNNYDVCIIDKAVFPREKLCGGLVTQKTIEVLKELIVNFEIGDFTCNSSDSVEMFSVTNKIASTITDKPFYFTERESFDNKLIEFYKAHGGRILENARVEKVDTQNRLVHMSSGEIIQYKYLVGADGANSMVRKALGAELKSIGFCLEANIPKARLKDIGNKIQIHFGVIENGYGWVFPKGDYYSVGIGNRYVKDFDYLNSLHNYFKIIGIDEYEGIKHKGAFVPFGDAVSKPVEFGNVFLVGDAAGLVDPLNGEGLFFALSSGKEAAKAITSPGKDKTTEYLIKTRGLRKYVVDGNWLQKIFYKPLVQKHLFKAAKDHSNFIRFYCDNQVSYYRYSYKKIALFPVYYYIKKFSGEKRNGHK